LIWNANRRLDQQVRQPTISPTPRQSKPAAPSNTKQDVTEHVKAQKNEQQKRRKMNTSRGQDAFLLWRPRPPTCSKIVIAHEFEVSKTNILGFTRSDNYILRL
jgi:hypothetical protein